MLTSAPFDDWWHAAYGLDVKIISPPHALLSLGIFSVQVGALLLILGYMNRSDGALQRQVPAALPLRRRHHRRARHAVPHGGDRPQAMHTAELYRAVAIALPFMLVGISRAAPHRWACTIMAAIYTLLPDGAGVDPAAVPRRAQARAGLLQRHALRAAGVSAAALGAGGGARSAAARLVALGRRGARRWRRARCSSPSSSPCSGRSPTSCSRRSRATGVFGTHYFGYYEHPSWLRPPISLLAAGQRRALLRSVMARRRRAGAMVGSALGLRLGATGCAGCKR